MSPTQHDRWFRRVLDRTASTLRSHPLVLLGLVVLALAMLPVAVWLDLRTLSREVLERQADDLNVVITDFRDYYTRNVVGRVLNHGGGDVQVTSDYEIVPGAIPIPATLSIELGDMISGRADQLSYRFVSDEPFHGRADHELSAFERGALATFRENGRDEPIVNISGSLFDRVIEMAVPVRMGQACVACHNRHPDSPSKDWQVSEVRGIQAFTVHQPIVDNLLSFRYTLTYMAFAGFLGLSFAGMQWSEARRFSRMNDDLEEMNSFLATVSMKISKYLSPQVYKSIFSGERDAVIATERKKLTIFFSDIENFTSTAERLQPEELTALLNEYFSEMSKIAERHGATIDKFIGDAILAFFGDPETAGVREDARLCVEMALDMQSRLVELSTDWRRRGITLPLRARMGINTGYCNVGNFGSEQRMDYTIIGAEANLAARLESIAPPGGIAVSHETYNLLEDELEARPLEPIRLKGIAHSVTPYVVEGWRGEAVATVGETSAGLVRFAIDPNRMTPGEIEAAKRALRSAMEALQERDRGSVA